MLISLISTKLPDRPWQQAATAFFFFFPFWKGHTYIIVADYFSIYTYWAVLSQMSAARIIQNLKPVLARCEIPKFFTEGCGPYINSSDASLAFAENVDLFFNSHVRSHATFSAKRR